MAPPCSCRSDVSTRPLRSPSQSTPTPAFREVGTALAGGWVRLCLVPPPMASYLPGHEETPCLPTRNVLAAPSALRGFRRSLGSEWIHAAFPFIFCFLKKRDSSVGSLHGRTANFLPASPLCRRHLCLRPPGWKTGLVPALVFVRVCTQGSFPPFGTPPRLPTQLPCREALWPLCQVEFVSFLAPCTVRQCCLALRVHVSGVQ